MKDGRGDLSTCNIFSYYELQLICASFFVRCIIPAVKRVIHFWRHFITVLNMKNSYISLNLVNVKYTSLKTISFYCIFTHTEYLSYIWSPLHFKSVKTISFYWRLYLYIIIRLHLKSVTCDLFVFVVTWMQTRKKKTSIKVYISTECVLTATL